METALIICEWTQFTSAMTLFGGNLFRLLLNRAAFDAVLIRWLRGMTLVALLSAIGWLMLEAANMGDGWADMANLAIVADVLRHTEFGHLWMAHLALGLFLLPVMLSPPSRRAWQFGAGLSGLFLASLAFTGHAVMEEGMAGIVHPLSQTVHLLAAGAWTGALLPLWLSLRRTNDDLARRAMTRFAPLGYVAAALVIASGVVNGGFTVDAFADLVSTAYGRTLLAKAALVAGMLACAAFNRFHAAPAMEKGVAVKAALLRSVTLEMALALSALALASCLGNLPPP